jgi:Domain of Unknown Function with PDB structure (DUF3857)/Transglutaminase-like superfamily
MRFLLLLIICFSQVAVQAGEGYYPVSAIPANLLKKANVVKRYEEVKFTVKTVGKAAEYHKYILTILNEKGDKFAQVVESYDKLRSIDYIDGTLYDAAGKKIKSLKKADISDLSGSDEGSLADDNRIKAHNFYHRTYPYTVEYEIKVDIDYTMFFPTWLPVDYELMAVEESRFSIVCPDDFGIRFKAFNYKEQPIETKAGDTKTYSWQLKNFEATQDEYASPEWMEITPCVYTGPVDFGLKDYSGRMDTWNNFGKFFNELKSGRDVLPEPIRQKVHQLTDGVSNEKDKIAKLYKFMQDNTRYISIQLGVGGWQPFDAAYVAEKKFGDCKALVNYMHALLKEAGIPSNYTLVRSGSGNHFINDDFPSSPFNHVILNVPLQKDTVWLECTSQTLTSGYLSRFTSNRYVLSVNENGGTLMRTPKYGVKENLQVRTIKAAIDETGTAAINAKTNYKAEQQDDLHDKIKGLSKEKVLDLLKEEIDLPQYDVVKYDYQESFDGNLPIVAELLELTAPNYAQISGKRLFVAPNLLTKLYRKLTPDTSRKYPVQLNFAYTDIDSVEIEIPAGYIPEALPAPVNISGAFGRYSCMVKVEGTRIFYYRSLENFSGRFPASSYAELVKFREQVYKADRSKVVMVKKE